MALIDIPGLPVIETLKHEGRRIVPLEEGLKLPHKEVAILNLMPMKEQTERQLLRRMSMVKDLVHVTFLVTESYTPTHTPKEHLEKFYVYPSSIKDKTFDGLIITGSPLEFMPYDKVTYWDELLDLMKYAEDHVGSVFYICWAAQAALYYYYGIDKQYFPFKASGIFCHHLLEASPISEGMETPFYVPESRNTTNRTEDLQKDPRLKAVAEAEEAGIYLAVDEEKRRIFVTGHSEYEVDTLRYEYLRDTAKGLKVPIPKNYIAAGEETKDPMEWTLSDRWEKHSVLLWNNWFQYYAKKPHP